MVEPFPHNRAKTVPLQPARIRSARGVTGAQLARSASHRRLRRWAHVVSSNATPEPVILVPRLSSPCVDSQPGPIAIGQVGLESATVGLKVRVNELPGAARKRKVLQAARLGVATN